MTCPRDYGSIVAVEWGSFGSDPPKFRLADWIVDVKACRLVRGACEIRLRPLLVDLLVLLATRPNQVVTKDEIIDRVWQGRHISESALTRAMTELRHLLGDDAREARIVETIHKRGYRLIASVERLRESSELRLAVLPFENLNRDPEHDYFAAGVSDALTTELGSIASLQVVSRHSVLAVTCSGATLAEIARRLRVDAVVEGSALHSGGAVRISAQLIQADPERHLWAESYVCEVSEILQLHGRITRAIAEAVHAALTPSDMTRLTRARPKHPEANLSYLKARHYLLHWDRDSLEKGFAQAQHTLQLDPTYAPAYALLAHGLTVLGYWCYMPIDVAYPRSKEAALKAVQLDDSLGEAHAVLGCMKWLLDWDLDGCEAEMLRALDLNPSSELAHELYALFLAVSREDRERSTIHARMLLEIDPLSMNSNFFAAWLHFFCGDYSKAAHQAQNTIEMYPHCLHAHYCAGWAALAENRYSDAIAAYEEAAALSRDAVSIAYLAIARGRAGDSKVARALLSELTAKHDAEGVPEFLFALVYSALGESDAALESMKRCYAARDARMFWFKLAPIGGALLVDRRFQALLGQVEATLRAPGTPMASAG